MIAGGCEHLGEPGSLGGDHHGSFLLPGVAPCRRACLRVEVDDDGGPAGPLGRNREVECERGLSGSAFL